MTTSVVTGTNRGIGLALVSALHARGDHVIAACRSASDELRALGVEIVDGVDVATEEGVQRLTHAVGARVIDLLINNAGILVWGDRLESLRYAEILQQFTVNAVGPLRVTAGLRQNLRRGSKVAFITSRMGSIGDNRSGGAYGYRMSKAALNIAAVSMARDLEKDGVAIVVLHPGMVSTAMINHQGQLEPEQSTAGLLTRIEGLTLETSGRFWHANGEELPW